MEKRGISADFTEREDVSSECRSPPLLETFNSSRKCVFFFFPISDCGSPSKHVPLERVGCLKDQAVSWCFLGECFTSLLIFSFFYSPSDQPGTANSSCFTEKRKANPNWCFQPCCLSCVWWPWWRAKAPEASLLVNECVFPAYICLKWKFFLCLHGSVELFQPNSFTVWFTAASCGVRGPPQRLDPLRCWRNQGENINKWDLGGETGGFGVSSGLIPDLINKHSGKHSLWPECVWFFFFLSRLQGRLKGPGETLMDVSNAHSSEEQEQFIFLAGVN